MREFDTGATRDGEVGKLDYEGFLSPLALRCYAEYLDRHRVQADGALRDSDNWQRGIPPDVYMKSMWRHFVALWSLHRGHPANEDLETALCAVLFNAMGYLHEVLKEKADDRASTLRAHINDLEEAFIRTSPLEESTHKGESEGVAPTADDEAFCRLIEKYGDEQMQRTWRQLYSGALHQEMAAALSTEDVLNVSPKSPDARYMD